MREIKFRGKRSNNGEWVYGYLFKIWEQTYILWGTTNGVPNMIEVDPQTVSQYTGLKDKNGKEIYEGDIVLHGDDEGVVVFDQCEFSLKIKEQKYIQHGLLTEFGREKIEVIGNIYENPDLLEGA